MTSEEYAKKVQATILSAGTREMESAFTHQPNAATGLFALAIGGASAVRGKGREHEADTNVQSFERIGAKCVDFLAEVRDELTDAAAWVTAADAISRMSTEDRSRYRDSFIWHLACAIDALDSWTVFEQAAQYRNNESRYENGGYREFIRPEDQPA